ncbi:BnaA06g32470D [Brassica napus]|uniref:BnaA06g32470D protein n=1 Tax=Brassica napus TaxID=3708 RepID=A0A078FKL4_BRANA|nr:BnaA06g32470D [Brassica napus]
MEIILNTYTIKYSQTTNLSRNFCCLRAHVSSEVQDIRTNSFSFYGPSHDPKPPEADEELEFDHEDGFGGFLTIGTLGRDPETPRFTSVAKEDVTGVHKDIAKLITEKLDKLLEEYPEDSSSEQAERSNAKEHRESVDVCKDRIEFTKSSKEVKKKEGLLASLFKRSKTVEGECNTLKKHGTGDLIKTVFEKLHMSSSKTIKDDNDDYMHKKKDIRKNVQNFRSKVHPVLSTPAREDNEIDDRSCTNRKDPPALNGGFLVSSSISEANWKREKWIKTDAECKSRSSLYTIFEH